MSASMRRYSPPMRGYNGIILGCFPRTRSKDFPRKFETKTPQEIIQWAVDEFWPQVALSSSFQTQSVPLLHMASLVRHDILIFFLDTGYHFWETLMFQEQLASHWQLNVLSLYGMHAGMSSPANGSAPCPWKTQTCAASSTKSSQCSGACRI